jgi:two-component sensor histidine kinase
MALIHDQLYQSRDITRIDFAVYLKNLTQSLLLTYAELTSYVNLRVNADKVYFAIETAIPCGLIVNELVTNSLKHAFEQGQTGEIRVDLFSEEDDGYLMVVADTGKGLPEDLDVRSSRSLGLRLVRELAESQLMGTLEVNSQNGAEFRISFKLRKR